MFRVRLRQLIGQFLGEGEGSNPIRTDGHWVIWERRDEHGNSHGAIVVGSIRTGSAIPYRMAVEYSGDNLHLRDYIISDLTLESTSAYGRHCIFFPQISWWLKWGDMDKTFLVITPIEEEKVDV